MIDEERAEGNVTCDKLPEAMKNCSIRRVLPIPIGSVAAAFVSVAISFFMFLLVDLQFIPRVVWGIARVNQSKFKYYSKNTRGDCKCCNWYLGWYLLFNLGLILITVLLLVLYPVIGIMHATYMVARRVFRESNMYAQAATGGLLDRAGITDSEKERLAERIGGNPVGLVVLWIGDFLLLTGIVEGLKRWGSVYSLHRRILGVLCSALKVVDWAEDTFHIIPLKKILHDAKEAGVQELRKEEENDDPNGNRKAEPTKIGRVFAVISLIIAVYLWIWLLLKLA